MGSSGAQKCPRHVSKLLFLLVSGIQGEMGGSKHTSSRNILMEAESRSLQEHSVEKVSRHMFVLLGASGLRGCVRVVAGSCVRKSVAKSKGQAWTTRTKPPCTHCLWSEMPMLPPGLGDIWVHVTTKAY